MQSLDDEASGRPCNRASTLLTGDRPATPNTHHIMTTGDGLFYMGFKPSREVPWVRRGRTIVYIVHTVHVFSLYCMQTPVWQRVSHQCPHPGVSYVLTIRHPTSSEEVLHDHFLTRLSLIISTFK
jgi:hypothetical protein